MFALFNVYTMILQFYCIYLFVTSTRIIGALRYHSNDEILKYMKNFSSTSSLKTRVFSIGKSVSGIPLNVLEINQPGNRIGTPNIKFIGNIHGNEVVGREVLLRFMKYLDRQYKYKKLVKCLIDNTRIYILPTMNPDGFDMANKGECGGVTGRRNKNDYDLNRNFPDYFHGNSYGVVDDDYRRMIQPETAAIMDWMKETKFVLSASLHGGAMVANFPFDNYGSPDDQNNKGEALTPDHDVVYNLSKTYVDAHKRISKGVKCPQDEFGLWYFEDGITNGVRWYVLKGGMQDYNYIEEGCIEITLEISCCKYPPEKRLPLLLKENMEPLLKYGLQALRGVKGRIIDSQSNKPIANATLYVVGRKFPFKTSANGEFWRILQPGEYELKVLSLGYEPVIQEVTVEEYPEDECPHIPMTTISLTRKTRKKKL